MTHQDGSILSQSRYQVRALERSLDILEAFSLAQPELKLSEIASKVDLSTSTTLRLLSILEERGYVERSSLDDRYRIGVRAFELGSIYIQTTTPETEAQPFLRSLARECNQTANLAILDRGEIVHIAVVPPDRPIRFYATIGQRASAHSSGLGKVLLAGLSAEELEELAAQRGFIRHTDHTITTIDALRTHLAHVRNQGFALDNEESEVGLKCVAAPVRDDKNRLIAAVSISGSAFEFNEEILPRYIDAVVHAARKISARLGNNVQPRGPHHTAEPAIGSWDRARVGSEKGLESR